MREDLGRAIGMLRQEAIAWADIEPPAYNRHATQLDYWGQQVAEGLDALNVMAWPDMCDVVRLAVLRRRTLCSSERVEIEGRLRSAVKVPE